MIGEGQDAEREDNGITLQRLGSGIVLNPLKERDAEERDNSMETPASPLSERVFVDRSMMERISARSLTGSRDWFVFIRAPRKMWQSTLYYKAIYTIFMSMSRDTFNRTEARMVRSLLSFCHSLFSSHTQLHLEVSCYWFRYGTTSDCIPVPVAKWIC